jgi:hypothetical protein
MSWADGTPVEYEELGGPPVESDEPEEPGAIPTTEMDDVETAERRELCSGYAANCKCPKGNA